MFIYTFSDVLVVFVLFFFIGYFTFNATNKWLKQRKCKHEQVFENSACDAICINCRKNFGFIGKWQKNENQTFTINRRYL